MSLWSPGELAVVGRRDAQATLARELGATSFATNHAGGTFDLAIEAAGATEALGTAARSVRRGGQVLALGLPPTSSTLELPGDLLVNNDLSLVGSFGYTSAAWTRTVELLNVGRLRLGRLITHQFPLDDYASAFDELAAPSGARAKVMLEVAGG
jgi:threonine dehydrogenase-like Zn-dependent dehydrogenase